MEDSFNLEVTYYGKERSFETKLIPYGFTHRFLVDIDGVSIYFEPDEERNYRAILSDDAIKKNLKPNAELIRLIGEKIEELFSARS